MCTPLGLRRTSLVRVDGSGPEDDLNLVGVCTVCPTKDVSFVRRVPPERPSSPVQPKLIHVPVVP